MSLGVLNNLSALYAENNLNNSNNSLNTVLQQLSSGSKINSGADDAAGLSLVNGLQANQQALTQSITNATESVGLLQVADGALSQVTSLFHSTGDGEFFFQLLLAVEAGVVAVEGEQLIVPAQLHNSAVVKHCDLIGIAHS
jgi:hypothetical protein